MKSCVLLEDRTIGKESNQKYGTGKRLDQWCAMGAIWRGTPDQRNKNARFRYSVVKGRWFAQNRGFVRIFLRTGSCYRNAARVRYTFGFVTALVRATFIGMAALARVREDSTSAETGHNDQGPAA